ncbi:MAG: hypothetical protein GY847_24455 [Proteobacteria bacterium]|nr:hypothetical protein [Pseudomonadota bacterium]
MGFSKLGDYRDTDEVSASDAKEVKRFRIAGRILLGTSVAMAATTGIVYLLIKKDKPSKKTAQLRPWATENGGGFAIKGSF